MSVFAPLADGGNHIVQPRPAANGEFWERGAVRRRELSLAFHAIYCGGMGLADDIVRELLTVGREVAVREGGAGQALVASDRGTFETREREARKPTHVDIVGS